MNTKNLTRFPDFLIGGVAKSGTSSLYHYLKQHPSIFMASIRATNFYGLGEQPLIQYSGPVKKRKPKKATLEEFANLYEQVPSDKIIGEGSSFFNFTVRAAQRIHYYNPKSKLIFVLRHPSDRAFSQYLYARKCGWEPCSSFEKALAEEPKEEKGRLVSLPII